MKDGGLFGTEDQVVILIDGTGLMYRAFYAIRGLTGPSGEPTNAAYGFTNMLLRLIDDCEPGYMAVAFDTGRPEYRLEKYPDYKGHRPDMPDDLRPQFDYARDVLQAMGIPSLEIEGVEADDVIGTVAARFASEGTDVLIVTGDRDFLQLVSGRVGVLLTRRGITRMDRYDRERVEEELELPPERLADLKGLMGDSSDNIPGVPGVGEKTGVRLLKEFGTLEETLQNIDRVWGKKLPESLRENRELALLSKELGTIRCDIPVEVSLQDCRIQEQDAAALAEVLRRLGFTSIVERLGLDDLPRKFGEGVAIEAMKILEDEDSLPEIDDGADAVVDWVIGDDGGPLYVSVHLPSEGYACTVNNADDTGGHLARELLKKIAAIRDGRVTGYHFKPLLVWAGVRQFASHLFDIKVAAYVVDPTRSSYPLEGLGYGYLGSSIPTHEDAEIGDAEALVAFSSARLQAMESLASALEAELDVAGLGPLFAEIEAPLIPILAAMQRRGIQADEEILTKQGEDLALRTSDLQQQIWNEAGEEFNINSPKQLGVILFEKLKLDVIKRTKTGPSTDSEVLGQLATKHEVPRLVLLYRHLVKLRGTYVTGLLKQIEPCTGRIHTTFKQSVTATGRLSSADPNLQNIPIRDEEGRQLRRAFGTEPGWKLVAADYSQIELRILAHVSSDDKLIEAFTRGEDIHSRTAAEVFGVTPDEVTPEMRSAAKAVNFGIIYGISGYGLSRSLDIDPAESQKYIDDYLERLPGVRDYFRRVIAEARSNGYVRTLMGRIRHLPEINDRVWHRRRFAERAAMNTPLQGTAADIIKKAMIEMATALTETDIDCHLLLQVHDELIWEVKETQVDDLCVLARDVMEKSTVLKVPLKVDLKVGSNWYDMHPVHLQDD